MNFGTNLELWDPNDTEGWTTVVRKTRRPPKRVKRDYDDVHILAPIVFVRHRGRTEILVVNNGFSYDLPSKNQISILEKEGLIRVVATHRFHYYVIPIAEWTGEYLDAVPLRLAHQLQWVTSWSLDENKNLSDRLRTLYRWAEYDANRLPRELVPLFCSNYSL